jgi:hypothetical protein
MAFLILSSAIPFSRLVIGERERVIADANAYWKIAAILDGLEKDIRTWRIKTLEDIRPVYIPSLSELRRLAPVMDLEDIRPVYIGVIADHAVINGHTLAYYAAAQGHRWTVKAFPGMRFEEFQQKIEGYDYVILRDPLTHTQAETWPRKAQIEAMARYFYEDVRSFSILMRLTLGDGSETRVFRNRRPGATDWSPRSGVREELRD